MAACQTCGTTNAEGARFCSNCGGTLGAVCPSCGAEVAPSARFCSSCGATLVAQGLAGDERKLVTVLFADVEGSTTLGERLDPEHMRDVLRTYFQAMREEIEAEGGTIEKFIGDAVMAAFGVPVAHEDDPARALRAAMRMLRRLPVVNEELAREHAVNLAIRIGVNTGEVLATNEPRPGEAMVTGDAVNVAARLQTAAGAGEVLTSERTAGAVRGFRLEPAGPLELKGKLGPVQAFRVLGEGESQERGVPGLTAPIVGRDAELDLLASLFDRVRTEHRPNLVTIYGDAGVGKSRLTREFLHRVSAGNVTVLRGRCLPYGESITFWPLAEILKSYAGVLDTDAAEIALERIRAAGGALLSGALAPNPAQTTAALAFTLGVEDPSLPFASMDPKVVRAEVHSAWRSFFSALSSASPLIVIVEDIHWADPSLLDLLEELAERVVGSTLFLCPARPELAAHRPSWGGGRRNHTSIALEPLGAEDFEHLFVLLLSIDDLPASLRRRILERAEGNPFFLEEILRHLIDTGLVLRDGERWHAAADIAEVHIPDTVQGVLAARIDYLEPAHKRVLQAAAVVGRVFWPGPISQLVTTVDVDAALRTLESRDLVLSRLGSSIGGEPEFAFKHVLTRDVAYESLPKRERAPAHAAVAGWIEQMSGARSREFVELLAYHYATSAADSQSSGNGLRRKAFENLLAASVDSRRKQVLKKAEKLAEDALNFAANDLERAIALEAIADAFVTDYDGSPAWHFFCEAAHTRERAEPADPRKVAYLCARACEVPIRWRGSMQVIPSEQEVREIYELGYQNLVPGDSEERARLLALGAAWLFGFPREHATDSEYEAARAQGLEAAEMALRLALPDLASAAFDAADGPELAAGRYDLALEIWLRREQLYPVVNDALERGDICAMGAWCLHELGRYAESRDVAEKYLPDIAGLTVSAEVHVQAWLIASLECLGEWDEALTRFERVRELLGDRRDEPPYFATHAFGAAAMIHEARGERLESDRLTGMLVALGRPDARLYPVLTLLHVERGQIEQAQSYFAQRPASWRVHGAKVLAARCELVAASGTWSQASAAASEARAFAEFGARQLIPFADRLEGRAALHAEADDAPALLQRAVSGFAQLGMRVEEARTRVELAEVLKARGESEQASAVLDAATACFEALRASKDLQRAANALK